MVLLPSNARLGIRLAFPARHEASYDLRRYPWHVTHTQPTMHSQPTESTSASLLRRVSDFDQGAWVRLSRIYTPFVYRWCRQSGLQSSDIDDVTQEVFRSVATGLDGYLTSTRGKFRGWLWGVTRNKLVDHFRRVGKEARPVGGETGQELMHEVMESISEAVSNLDINGDVIVVQRTLQLLKDEFEEQTWQAFWRTTVGNERATDIAEELGMTKKAVRQAKYRILKRLRAELELQLDRQVT